MTRTCKICGKRYESCDSCDKIRTFTPWRTVTCSSQEFLVFTILSKYSADQNAKDAFQSLHQLNLSKAQIASFLPSIRETIEEIRVAARPNKSKKQIMKVVKASHEEDLSDMQERV